MAKSKIVQALLDLKSGNAALLYLYRSEHKPPLNPFEIMRFFGWSEATLKIAFSELVGGGIVKADEMPDFSSEGAVSVAEAMREEGGDFVRLYEELQRRLNKVFSNNDLNILSQIYYQLSLPTDVILLLAQHCMQECRYQSGQPGRIPTMIQLRKEAGFWSQNGIDTAAAAEEYVSRRSKLRTRYEALLPRIGIARRAPVRQEEEHLQRWIDWGFPDDVIVLAYERTVFKKQEFRWGYCNGILRNWEKNGLFTVPAIEEFDSHQKKDAKAPIDDDILWMKELFQGKEP